VGVLHGEGVQGIGGCHGADLTALDMHSEGVSGMGV
jgi:hypothetical protein